MSYIFIPILLGLLFGFGFYGGFITILRWKKGYGFEVIDFVISIVLLLIGTFPLYVMSTWI